MKYTELQVPQKMQLFVTMVYENVTIVWTV
jgi:hypothetical protein